MKQRSKLFLIIAFFSSSISFSNAQGDLLLMLDSAESSGRKVFATFKTTRIVNAHSIETVKRKTLDFRVTHHFGDVSGEGGGAHTLFGLDQATDIRIAFEYGVTNGLTLGFGRSKIGEMIDGFAKLRIAQQTTDKIPVSATIFANTAFTPQRNVNGDYDNTAHRFSYTSRR